MSPTSSGPFPWLDLIIQALVQGNVAIPIIFTTVLGIVNIFKAAFGNGPSLAEISAAIRAQIAENDTKGRAEVDRLEAMLGNA